MSLSDDDMGRNQECGLYDAIVDRFTYSEFSQKDFLPQNDFESLITEHTIKEELDKAAFGEYDSSLVKYITKHARKTFATLVYGDAVRRAINLERFEFGDRYLPIALEGPRLISLNGFARDSSAWKWFNKWRTQEKHFFCKEQWVFLPQIFRNDSTMENLHRDCRLPFIACESQGEGGSFSLLHKATIHRAHQTVSSDNLVIAIKELRNKEAGADQSELDALDLARQLKHPHIVRFVGGFRQNFTSHLLFQWADGGNLRSYWNNEENWSRDADLISWTIEQIQGLVAALDQWHNNPSRLALNGRHGDLKPENILRSSGSHRGIFQIADLGLAKIHSLPTHARNKPSASPGGTLRYRPPEVGRKISRSYDMWGMGCIILEWIIWLVYGIHELDEFCQQAFPEEFDAFWLRDSESRTTNPVVASWMKHMTDTCLADGDQCYSAALRKLLIFVRDRLLVPDSTEQDTSDSYHPSADNEEVPIYITPAPDVRHNSPISGRAKGKDACREIERISSTTHGIPYYMYNPMVNMSGPNGRGPAMPSKLLMPLSTSNFRLEVNGPPGNR
ncbi:hypothetical protein J4E86_004543 [Alternaria arbusti]|uniref:uncharacterized protein n=2 Tax=Alternaria sect. Infectoriae TaxID=2499258 RepID=UPI00221F0226|nr:uncharacterized protein J4E86_004543 [Alternaria arbusti]KAI4957405.1 hypothetical protein J4E86_004543 [Alternaria arbusti]